MKFLLKNYLKKNFATEYAKIRTALFSFYIQLRALRLQSFKEEALYNFSYAGIHFKIVLDPRNGFIDQEIYWKGVYEEEILDFYTKHIKSGDTFVDIGTNIGEHTLFNSKLVGVTGHVISFEPIQRLYAQVSKSVALNTMNNVFVVNKACGEKEEDMTIYLRDQNIGGSSLVPFLEKGGEEETIHIIQADSILKDYTRVDFIKIDTEGYEYEALLGLEETLRKHSPSLLIEYSPIFYKHNAIDENHNGHKILSLLQKYNYKVFDLEDGEKEVTSLITWGETFSKDQTNIFCTK
jgi:FkbM family methyltransferase